MSAAAGILEFEDLKRIMKCDQAAAIERRLKKQGIRVFWGKDGVWTTIDLINAAGGLKNPAPADNDELL